MSFADRSSDLRFEFQLARDLKQTVGQLRLGMTSKELAYWSRLYQVEALEREGKNPSIALDTREAKARRTRGRDA